MVMCRFSDNLNCSGYEAIFSVVRAAVKTGIHKFRLTGGEPLVCKGICELIRKMASVTGVDVVSLTTNGG
jgi:GTP 3',8-cyclase